MFAFVVLCDGAKCNLGESLELLKEMNHILSIEIGKIAKLDNVMYVPGLPKTRSGKIMRSAFEIHRQKRAYHSRFKHARRCECG